MKGEKIRMAICCCTTSLRASLFEKWVPGAHVPGRDALSGRILDSEVLSIESGRKSDLKDELATGSVDGWSTKHDAVQQVSCNVKGRLTPLLLHQEIPIELHITTKDCSAKQFSFNSDVTRHSAENFRKYSNLSRVTEGIFECAAKATKSAKNGLKKSNFRAHYAFLLPNAEELSRNAALGGNESLSGPSGILRLLGRPLIAARATESTEKV
ncbi:hypothetical protein B0H11DRAFT_1935760 [Mycena galericulata]|nr:hypothetical protein B0H11DRAFT_1935760 [Mycena galericulata]